MVSYLSGTGGAERRIPRGHKVLFVTGGIHLPDALLYILVEGCLPELLVGPHSMLLYTGIGELVHVRTQLLLAKSKHSVNYTSVTEISSISMTNFEADSG